VRARGRDAVRHRLLGDDARAECPCSKFHTNRTYAPQRIVEPVLVAGTAVSVRGWRSAPSHACHRRIGRREPHHTNRTRITPAQGDSRMRRAINPRDDDHGAIPIRATWPVQVDTGIALRPTPEDPLRRPRPCRAGEHHGIDDGMVGNQVDQYASEARCSWPRRSPWRLVL